MPRGCNNELLVNLARVQNGRDLRSSGTAPANNRSPNLSATGPKDRLIDEKCGQCQSK